jgi:hypothetical protein
VHPNPNSGTEWLEFYLTPETVTNFNLAGFTVFDNTRQIYKFNEEAFSNQLLIINVSGLNNDADSVILKDETGNILDTFTYEKSEKGLSWSRIPNENIFILSTPSYNLPNPAPSPTPTSTIAPTVTPSSTVTPSLTVSPTPGNTITPQPTFLSQLNLQQEKILLQKLSKPESIKLISHNSDYQTRNLRLVFLSNSPKQSLIVNAIIGSLLIILSSAVLLYGKIKKHLPS